MRFFSNRKVLLGTAFAGLLLSLISVEILWHVWTRANILAEHQEASFNTERIAQEVARMTQEINQIDTVSGAKMMYAKVLGLGNEPRAVLKPIALAKLTEIRFKEQEHLLRGVAALLKANEHDPVAKEYLARAKALNDENQSTLDELQEIEGDCAWNRNILYLKSAILYRALVFRERGENFKARDIIDQAVRSAEKIFACVSGDRDAEVLIELLYKEEEQASGDDKGASRRLRALPPADGPGTGRSDRERGRY